MENEEVEDVARVRGAVRGDRNELGACVVLYADGDELGLSRSEDVDVEGSGRWTSCPLALALDEEEVVLDLEDSPITPPRSLAFRTSVARSGLEAVPAERSKLLRLLLVLVLVLAPPVPASGGASVILLSGGAEESKLAFICADSESAAGSTAPVPVLV